jgi:hypothetical protein
LQAPWLACRLGLFLVHVYRGLALHQAP